MHKLYKIVRSVNSVANPLATRVNVLCKALSSTCGNDDDGKDGENKDESCSCSCTCCNSPCGNTLSAYDCRKYSAGLPGNTRAQCHFGILNDFPADVFRCTDGECLGPQGQASKCGCYRNPEYFAFHHMSFYDFYVAMSKYRLDIKIQTGRKPP